MKNDLIARYIYAVTRHLPQKMQADVEKELESLISDMLEESYGAKEPSEQEIKAVLTELGNPDDLAAKYLGDEKKALISGVYYFHYKRILRYVLPFITALIAGLSILNGILNWGTFESTGEIVRQFTFVPIIEAYQAAVSIFAGITLLFVILERKKTKWLEEEFGIGNDSLDNLPQVPGTAEKISMWQPIGGIIGVVVTTTVFLSFPQIIAGRFSGVGWVSVFNVEVIRSLWLPILLWAAIHIVWEVMRLIEGRYTKRLAVIGVAVNVAIAACAAFVLASGAIMNPEFIIQMGNVLPPDPGGILYLMFGYPNLFLLGGIVLALVIDSISGMIKAFRTRVRIY
ncbi:MAG: hypothetical protein FWE04_04675 [Oscillospiraceae bacterium]|nr:hypothetical protein [Oscillospiraceae bacterium]